MTNTMRYVTIVAKLKFNLGTNLIFSPQAWVINPTVCKVHFLEKICKKYQSTYNIIFSEHTILPPVNIHSSTSMFYVQRGQHTSTYINILLLCDGIPLSFDYYVQHGQHTSTYINILLLCAAIPLSFGYYVQCGQHLLPQ